MSSRKAVVLWIAVAVILSVGLGIVIAGEVTGDKHTVSQADDAEVDGESTIDDEPTIESGFATVTDIDNLTGAQTVIFTDIFTDLENYENSLLDDTVDRFSFGSGSKFSSNSKQGRGSGSNPGQGPKAGPKEDSDDTESESERGPNPGVGHEAGSRSESRSASSNKQGRGPRPESESDSNSKRGPAPESVPGQGPEPRLEDDSDDAESEQGSEPESESEPEPESESEPEPEPESQSESEPEGNADDTEPAQETEPESGSDQDSEPESASESQSESEPEGNAEDSASDPESESEPQSGPDQEPGPESESEDTESSSERSESSTSSGSGSGGSDSPEPTVTRTETGDAITIHVDDVNGESVVQSLDLAGPSETDPAISLSALEIDPADREQFGITVARPTSDSGELPAVPHGEALAYVDLGTDLDANGTTNLSFGLDRAAIPDGLGIEDVDVLGYTDGEWTATGVDHDVGEADHRVTLSEASPIAVVALDPGSVEVVDADVPADWVRAGYETRAKVTVRNAGDRPVTDTLVIAMDGETVAERSVSLAPDETATVELVFEPTDSGAVMLDGSEIGTLTVADGNGGDDENSVAEEPAAAENMPGFGPVSFVLALLVVILAVRIRR